MWTRSELKDRAKVYLNANYWKAVLVSLILAFVGGAGGSSASSSASQSYKSESGSYSLSPHDWAIIGTVILLVLVVVFIVMIISSLLSIFVFNPLIVGCRRFFINCKEESPSINIVTYAFSHSYGNVIKTMFLQGLFTFLWSLLFIIPGIIKAYEYLMIPYILAENPEISSKEAFARSKAMMDGEKWNAFVLGLSFIGWEILAAFTCCILSIFYVAPYRNLTFAQLYETLKNKQNNPS